MFSRLVVYLIGLFYTFFSLIILNTCFIMLFRKFAHQLFCRGQAKINLKRIARRKQRHRKLISSKTVRSRLKPTHLIEPTRISTVLQPVSRIEQSTVKQAHQTSAAKSSNSIEMIHLDNLIDGSVQEYLKIKEDESLKNRNSKVTEASKSIDGESKNEKKRKIEDESSDEECFKLPRRRVMTMGEFNKRKRIMTKYHRELVKEREEEKFFANVYDEDYDDSLADFVVAEDSMFIDSQMMSSDNDVHTTSAFLRENPSFVDDECEEVQVEHKDCFSDSEEEQMYLNARGFQNFYDKNEAKNNSFIDECREDKIERKDCFSDSEEEEMYLNAKGMTRGDLYSSDVDFLDDGETLSDSSEFTRNIERKRPCHNFVIDDVSVEEGEDLETDDLDDEIEEDDNGSDLDSFINDSTMIEEEESDDEDAVTNLNSSDFHKTKKRTKRVIRLDSSDEENVTVLEPSKTINNHKSPSILSTIENTSFNKSSQNTLDLIPHGNQQSKIDSKNENHALNIQCSQTIILDDSSQVALQNSKTLVIYDSDDEIKIRPKTKSKPLLFDSDNESEDLFMNEDHFSEKPDPTKPPILNNSKISNGPKFSTDDDSSADCSTNLKTSILITHKTNELYTNESWFEIKENDEAKENDKTIESDDKSVIEAKGRKPKKIFESDEDDENIMVQSTNKSNKKKKIFESDEDDEDIIVRPTNKRNKNVIESDDEILVKKFEIDSSSKTDKLEDSNESIECIFSEGDPINRSDKSDFELNEEDLEDGFENTLT